MGANALFVAAAALVAAAVCAPAQAAGILAPLSGHCTSEFARCGKTDCMDALGCVASCEAQGDCASQCSQGLSEEGGAALRSYRSCFRAAPEHSPSGSRAANGAEPLADGMRFRAKRTVLARAKRVAKRAAALQGKVFGGGAGDVLGGVMSLGTTAANKLFETHTLKSIQPTPSDKRSTCLAAVDSRRRPHSHSLPFRVPTLSCSPACVGCLFVWEQVAPHVGKNPEYDDVASVFEQTCQDQPDVFYSACDDMYAVENKLINTYLEQAKSNDFSADEICKEAQLCYSGLLQ